jgi:hypothetical protein
MKTRKLLFDIRKKQDDPIPIFRGVNHVVWKDGEPIDPFTACIKEENGDVLLSRTVLHDLTPILDHTPLQRCLSGRGNLGFSSFENFPEFSTSPFKDRSDPVTYFNQRLKYLYDQFANKVDKKDEEDQVLNVAERMRLLVPANRKSTANPWLQAMCCYGHYLWKMHQKLLQSSLMMSCLLNSNC